MAPLGGFLLSGLAMLLACPSPAAREQPVVPRGADGRFCCEACDYDEASGLQCRWCAPLPEPQAECAAKTVDCGDLETAWDPEAEVVRCVPMPDGVRITPGEGA